jgi:hypothetical protein
VDPVLILVLVHWIAVLVLGPPIKGIDRGSTSPSRQSWLARLPDTPHESKERGRCFNKTGATPLEYQGRLGEALAYAEDGAVFAALTMKEVTVPHRMGTPIISGASHVGDFARTEAVGLGTGEAIKPLPDLRAVAIHRCDVLQ